MTRARRSARVIGLLISWCLVVGATLGQVTAASASDSTVRTIAIGLDEMAPHLTADQVALAEVPASAVEKPSISDVEWAASSLPTFEPTSGADTLRIVTRSGTSLYLLDAVIGADTASTRMTMIDALGSAVPLGWSEVVQVGTEYLLDGEVDGVGLSAGAPVSSASAGPECTGCNLANFAGGVYSAAVCATFIGCVIKNGLGGFLGGEVCKVTACTGSTYKHSVTPSPAGNDVLCGYTSCDFEMWTRDGSAPSVTNIATTIQWTYPYPAFAQRSGGGYASVWSETKNPVAYSQTGFDHPYARYNWTFNSTDPNWVRCATNVKWSVTVTWKDGVWMSTGFQDATKPANVNCPGYRVA